MSTAVISRLSVLSPRCSPVCINMFHAIALNSYGLSESTPYTIYTEDGYAIAGRVPSEPIGEHIKFTASGVWAKRPDERLSGIKPAC
jgi:hypothetical protein